MKAVLIEGDGIGKEVVPAARRVLDASNIDIEFETALMGEDAIEEHGAPLPEETVAKIQEAGLALKGPVRTPIGSGFRSVNVELRKRLELYANIRPCCYMEGVQSRINRPEEIDIVVVRENLEDLYAGIEFERDTPASERLATMLRDEGFSPPQSAGYSIKPMSQKGSERVIRRAFDYAEERDREKVTVVDKANIMKYTDGLFMQVGETVAAEYDVEYEHLLVDNVAQQLVMRPEEFDVVVTQNIYGDILSDLCGGLIGGIGVVPSANVGEDAAVFASVHGTAPDIAGENKANPTALILSAAMLVEYAGRSETAERIRSAVRKVVERGETVTGDLGGSASTSAMTDAVIAEL